MEFINRMKKREFIEMTLKTLAAVLAAFVAIILMEAMIFGIQMNAYLTNGSGTSHVSGQYDAYCIEQKEDDYLILFHDEQAGWSCSATTHYKKADCEALKTDARNVYYRTPNAFEFSITPVHYVVMVLFVAVVGGYFVYRFVKLSKSYKQIKQQYNTTGTIEISNM